MKPIKAFYQQKEEDQRTFQQLPTQQDDKDIRQSLLDFAAHKGLKSLYYTQ